MRGRFTHLLLLLPLHLLHLVLFLSTLQSSSSSGNNINNKYDNNCEAKYRVYVYELNTYSNSNSNNDRQNNNVNNVDSDSYNNVLLASEQVRMQHKYHICKKCIYEQFALEYIIYDYFTQFCGRTWNPDEADYFYLPLHRDLLYRMALQSGGNRQPNVLDQLLLDAIENGNTTMFKAVLRVTDEYWKRNNGADHIIVMPAPVTNLRHQSNMRGFFHYMIQLSSPIFLNVELSLSFIKEYPICATSGKIIVMPYPNTDPDMLSGRLAPIDAMQWNKAKKRNNEYHRRDKLIFYHGGMHGSCEFIRRALVEIMQDARIGKQRGDRTREIGFYTARYCPIPVGDSPSSKRMYDVVNFGCVPVTLSDDVVWAYSTEQGGSIVERNFAVRLPQKVVQRSATRLVAELNKEHFHALPSGLHLYDILVDIAKEESKLPDNQSLAMIAASTQVNQKPKQYSFPSIDGRVTNTLVRILERIPEDDWFVLHQGAIKVAESYRYYALNASLATNDIPTARHAFPNGRALSILDQRLAALIQSGITDNNNRCQNERNRVRPKHKYIGNYPCEKQRRRRRRLFSSIGN